MHSTHDTATAPPVDQAVGYRWLLWAVLALAIGLRLWGLSSLPLEQDELYTLHDAEDFPSKINLLRPAYYFLQYVLLGVIPPTPLSLRLPPFVFGVLGVWLTWRLARQEFGPTAGLVAAILLAVSPWHLLASQFARYWTLVYALAAALYLLLLRSVDSDRPGFYLAALATTILGVLTHPTFLFPAVGAFLALFTVSHEGRLDLRWPTRRARAYLLGPLGVIGLVGFTVLVYTGSIGGMSGSRGFAAAIRLLPAMVQLASPVIVAAAAVSMVAHVTAGSGRDRRWGAVALAGCLTGVCLLIVASLRRSVYADYGMAMLPLLFVTIGGAVQRFSELAPSRRGFALGATLTLMAGVLPGTVSHLSDGTRFDYRPAYAHVRRMGADRLVVGWPGTIQRYYAPELTFEPFQGDTVFLRQTLERTSGFWLIGSYRRRGMLLANEGVERWMSTFCRRVLVTERPRLDYRTYRVELHWCGSDPPRVVGRTGAVLEGRQRELWEEASAAPQMLTSSRMVW